MGHGYTAGQYRALGLDVPCFAQRDQAPLL